MDVDELVEQAKSGDRDAFSALVSMSTDRLYAIAHRILRDGDAASDAVQEAFLDAWRDLPQLRDASRFQAWLYRVLVRACYRRASSDRAFRAGIRVLRADPIQPDEAEGIADRDALRLAFERLSVEQRAVVVLHHYLGLDLVETAAALGIPAGTARSRLHYAIRGLRADMDRVPSAARERTA
jgi:RNA polymerase sigma-70 factor (ECF subfamily)